MCPDPIDRQAGDPPAALVHRVHDRYLVEVVEELGLCPFARRSRELGRVHRPLVYIGTTPADPQRMADTIAAISTRHADAEIILLTFVVVEAPHPWHDAEGFAAFTPDVRQAYDALGAPRMFMVPFHRGFAACDGGPRGPTPEGLVPMLRRSPDPVIQCVRAEVLERVRAQVQATARERLRERFADDPVLRALLERSVQADPELSSDIARHNFASVGAGPGRAELEQRLADILRDRDEAYQHYSGR